MKKILLIATILVSFSVCCVDKNDDSDSIIIKEGQDEDNNDSQSVTFFEDVTFSQLPALDLMTNSMDVAFVDLDQDTDLDIVIASEFAQNLVLLNDGSGQFEIKRNILPTKSHDSEDIVVADFNNDGLLDIIFVSEDDQTNEYYIQSEDFTFIDASEKLGVSGISNAADKADIDQDGDIDLLIGNDGQNYLLINDGSGNFSEENHRLPSINDPTQDVEFGDANNDGYPDILVSNETMNFLHLNDGNGTFQKRELPHRSGVIEETREGDFFDIDGDGDLDIFFANVVFSNPAQKDPGNRILINDGSGTFMDETKDRFKGSNSNQSVDADFFDLDGDGDLDGVIANAFGTTHQVMINENGILVDKTNAYFSENETMGVDVEIADLNGDDLADVYFGTFQGMDLLFFGREN